MNKHFLKSKTMWGAFFMVAHATAMNFGYDIGDVQPWVDASIQATSAVLVIWGRVTATHKVKIA